ncbi:hypothetical protein [[Phormidium] sp. ETS-05]|uniref:hypothetical protein n=1 Tax=[Phormidium] sp. ETS-05 TaxID=222819 RepID=UPI0018EEF499|nr:hypothetical protein [[Phormidium] sp. ETS-05]
MGREIRSYIQAVGDGDNITKGTLEQLLKAATCNSAKGTYLKSRHAPEILKLLDVDKVRQAAGFCDRLFVTITNLLA